MFSSFNFDTFEVLNHFLDLFVFFFLRDYSLKEKEVSSIVNKLVRYRNIQEKVQILKEKMHLLLGKSKQT